MHMHKPSLVNVNQLYRDEPIYISAAMTGLADLGKKDLGDAQSKLYDWGFTRVLNPYDMVDQTKNYTWGECLKIDLREILRLDVKAIFLLDTWRPSKGACLEVIVALVLGIPIFDINGGNVYESVYASYTPEYLYEMFTKMVDTHKV